MKQIIDKTDNQPIIPIAVQPKLDPDGGLVENENGLAVKPNEAIITDLSSQLIDSGKAKMCIYGNIVTISLVDAVMKEKADGNHYTSIQLPEPIIGIECIVPMLSSPQADNIGRMWVDVFRGSRLSYSLKAGAGNNMVTSVLTYVCR